MCMNAIIDFLSGRSDVVVVVFLFLGFFVLSRICTREKRINEIIDEINKSLKEGVNDEESCSDK